ncbi:Protein SZT2 [Schistosoma japonicum]|nr:Protein SZT2 [Schistosoma japonicum]
MQPLKVNISPNCFSVNFESNPPFKRIHRNDDDSRFSSGNDNKRRATQSCDSHRCLTDSCCNSGPLVSRFPEFCPVKIEMTQHSAVDTNNSTHLSPTSCSDSNEFLNQNSPITQERYGINIHIPRQSLYLIFVNGRHIQMFTYNWTKEEAERLSTRLLLSVEWYNQRFQLLCSLSFQKLGLFHAINNNVFRGCAVRAMDLIRHTCPPELNISVDSPCTAVSQTSSNLYNTSPLPSVSSTATPQTVVSNVSMNTFSAAPSVTRKRHATPSAVDVNTSYINNNNNVFILSSPAFQTYSSSLHGANTSRTDIKENKTVNNFLRLFQDCGYIPHLIPPANPHLPYIDMLQRYSKQALTLVDADIRRSQYIELFSAYFRNWQEGSKNSTINKESDLTQSLSLNEDSGHKCLHSKSGGGSADALLFSDQLSKRLQRYSAIKQACRQLHTICTPILFCPNTRSKVVQLIKEEENAMNKTAHLYFSSISQNLNTVKPTDATEALATSTNSTTKGLTVHNEISDLDKIRYHTEQAANHFTSCGNKVNSSNNISLKSTSLKLKQVSDASGNRFLSPWLSWSHNSATPGNLDDASLLSTDVLLVDNNPRANVAQHGDNYHTSVINFNMWLRRVAHQFLMKYSQYLQQEVGFNSIPILNNSVTLNRREHTAKHNVNYALFRRSIHLAGVHIIELFIRDFHLFVRLGTIEVSRFSWHASRSVTLGPYTSEVISQTAASAAASMTSVMFNAVFRRKMEKSFRSPSVSSSFNAISSPSECKYSDWFQYSSNFSWNESSKLCDYTHLHSFSYDFHLRAIQDYLENRRCFHRNQCSDASRKPSSTVGNVHSSVITIPDYPVTKFLEDLSCIAQKLPLFSRGYLCCFPVTCHVSLCLRPDQVFHHLIEEHASYGVDILRMTRSEYGTSQTNPSYNKHLSYNFALVEQFHPEQESVCCSSRSANSDHHSKYQPCSNLRMSSDANSTLTISNDQSYKFSALGIANAHHIVENLTKLGGELSNLHSISQPYSVTGIVVPDETNGTYSDIRSSVNGSITNRLLHLIVYLIILDSKHEFPESRLAKLNSSSCTHCPVDWPAVRPCVDPCSFTYQPTLINRIPKSLGIEDTDLSVSITDRQYQNLNISSTFTSDDMRFLNNSKNTFDSDVRWHMSYLSMCPSHQVQLRRVLRISQSNLESRITQLIGRSGVDCHKNLLWYKLFDTNSSLASHILSTSSHSLSQDTVQSNYRMEHTPSISLGTNLNPMDSYLCPVLNHQSLSMREIEELVDSAPFQLDILRLDPRLIELFNVGGCHLNTVSALLNKEFVNLQQNSHHEIDHVKSNTCLKLYKYSTSETIACIAYRFSHSIEDNLNEAFDNGIQCHQCIKNYMVLLSPSFTEGLIFLSWCETRIGERALDEHFSLYTSSAINNVCINRTSTSGGCVDVGNNNVRKTQSNTTKSKINEYKDFQFRAVFRAVGDPTNPSSMRRLVDSGIEIQNLFFKASTLSLVATNFIEKLSFLVWKTMHN